MAKATTKKPKLTPEEQMAELARLTGSVASISHMGPSQPFIIPAPEPAVAPLAPPTAAAPPVAATAPVELPAALSMAARAVEAPQPVTTPAPLEPKGEKTSKAPVAPIQVEQPAAATGEKPGSPADADAEPTPGPTTGNTPQFSFEGLYAPSEEKKTFQVRITATHQQLFQQMGLLLGGGASSADVIHNILNQFVEQHEQHIQKALQRQLRQMMSPKK